MDFNLSDYDGFRAEVEQWCVERYPNGIGPMFRSRTWSHHDWNDYVKTTHKDLAQRGWLCGGWPIEYGGGGWTKVKQALFYELATYRRIPGTGNGNVAISTVGPTLMVFGTAEQKETYLPRIAAGDLKFDQGFSEPNAGSDLASMQTRADADGDEFVINGQKLWNHSATSGSDMMLLLARTDQNAPKHRGITQFILPIRTTRGVTMVPVEDTYGYERWTLLTLEDVRLPRSAVIGEVNRGWYQTATSLDFERSQMAWVGQGRRLLDDVVSYANRTTRNGRPLTSLPFVRDRLAELAVEIEIARWLSYRVAFLHDRGQVPNMEASMSKLWATEVQQRIQRAGMNVAGALGHLSTGSDWAEHDGSFDEDYWAAVGTTLAGGTSEVQRNIIATRGLGLPR